MTSIKRIWRELINQTRRQWLAEIIYKYEVRFPSQWSVFGYKTKHDFEEDLRYSVRSAYANTSCNE